MAMCSGVRHDIRRVAPGGCPPGAPTDPDVHTLGHPVPQVTPSLCRDLTSAVANPDLAIHWRYGDTLREFDASQVVPANSRVTRCLASHPPGPRGPSSPASSVLSRHCDFLPAFPPRFVAFAWRYHGNTHVSLPPPLRVTGVGPGVGRPVSPSGSASVETTGSPKFLGSPHFRLPMFWDPGRPTCSRPLRGGRVALRSANGKAPTFSRISRLDSMAFGLAVYVSRSGLLAPRARLASRCWSGSPGRAFTRRAPTVGF